MSRKAIGVPMDESMIDAVAEIAKRNQRSMAAQVRIWIEAALKREAEADG